MPRKPFRLRHEDRLRLAAVGFTDEQIAEMELILKDLVTSGAWKREDAQFQVHLAMTTMVLLEDEDDAKRRQARADGMQVLRNRASEHLPERRGTTV